MLGNMGVPGDYILDYVVSPNRRWTLPLQGPRTMKRQSFSPSYYPSNHAEGSCPTGTPLECWLNGVCEPGAYCRCDEGTCKNVDTNDDVLELIEDDCPSGETYECWFKGICRPDSYCQCKEHRCYNIKEAIQNLPAIIPVTRL